MIRLMNCSVYNKIFDIGKKVVLTGIIQIFIQLITFLTGVFVIRSLSTEEYAYYTLANTMLGAMSILSDSGISSGVTAIGGQDWKNKTHLGIVLSTGLKLRKKFAIQSWLIIIPILAYLLYNNDASMSSIFFIILSIIPIFFSSLSTSLLEIPLKLNQDIFPIQKNQILVSIGRVIAITLVFIFPFSSIALLVGAIPQLWMNRELWKLTNNYVDWKQKSDSNVRDKMIKIVNRLLPVGIYNCLSGQFTIWLIAIMGSTASIAQLGALSRFSVSLRILGTLAKTLVTPRFARLPKIKRSIFKMYIQVLTGFTVIFFIVVLFLNYFSFFILNLLGNNYVGLQSAFLLVIIGGCCEVFADLTFNLNSSRGWAINPFISIPINIFTTVLTIYFWGVSSLNDILKLAIISGLVQTITQIWYAFYKITQIKENSDVPL